MTSTDAKLILASVFTLIGREYLRVSYDKSGRERSPDEQHDDHVEAQEAFRFVLSGDEPYRDIGSASPYQRKARKDFDQLLKDLDTGTFCANGSNLLVLWEPSRGSRKTSEWCRLIELCAERRVKIYVHRNRRVYDPNHGGDVESLQSAAVKAQAFSWELSEAVKRGHKANAKAGIPHGRVPFGYRREYDFVWDTGKGRQVKVITQLVHEDEAPLVRELYARLRRGHSLRSIAKDWESRGIRNDKGVPFSPAHLRSIALNPSYAGIRIHDPNRRSGATRKLSADAKESKGDWPALVNRSMYRNVRRLLTAPERQTGKPGKGVHLLSMTLLCDRCSGPMVVTNRMGEPQFQCHKRGCVRVDKAGVDAYAEALLLGYLSHPTNLERLAAEDSNEAALSATEDDVARIQAEHDDLAAQVGSGRLSATLAAVSEPEILERLSKARQRVRELSTPSVLRGLLDMEHDVHQWWHDAPIRTKRMVVRLVFSRDVLGELRVTPSPTRGHRVPAVERLKLNDTPVTTFGNPYARDDMPVSA